MSLSKLPRQCLNYPAAFSIFVRNFHKTNKERYSKSKRYLLIASAISSALIGSPIYTNQFEALKPISSFTFNLKESLLNKYNSTFVTYAKEEPSNEKVLVITPRQKLFFQFASVEYNGMPYMTPLDFLESVTEDHPRPRIRRKILTKENLEKYLKNTPDRKKGSSRLFRSLEDRGIISYSEYLFLLCVITKPKSNFQIAFNMFDTDGNQRVDKKEFLVLEDIVSETNNSLVTRIFQRGSESKTSNDKILADEDASLQNLMTKNRLIDSLKVNKHNNSEKVAEKEFNTAIDTVDSSETTLLVHLFGQKGKNNLEFNDFKKFMEDLQKEVLEIEFNEFSKGMENISAIEFSELLLRYTDFDQAKKMRLIRKLHSKMDVHARGISFEKFLQFSSFMNNLGDFQLALKFHTLANKSISAAEFQRAVKISSGYELDPLIVEVIFKVFDENSDGQLSYMEFIAVLKDRLKRGLNAKGRHQMNDNYLSNYVNESDEPNDLLMKLDEDETYMKKFRNCLKKKMRSTD